MENNKSKHDTEKLYEEESLITETGESYRDRVSNIDKKGNRVWIYPKKPKGSFHRARALVATFLILLFFGLPFVNIGGQPFLLLDIINRHFIIFGLAFWPQDFHLFALAFLTIIVFVILFTTVFGRIWCGWACPQTVFMEMVFRKIEYFIEGDANAQKKLNNADWTGEKIFKKGAKYSVFAFLSFVIANFGLAYIIGIDEVFNGLQAGPIANPTGFIGIMAFTGAIYFVFSYFREQACTYVCPYGRLQSVLLDKNSIIVSYDFMRGEPKGRLQKGQIAEGNGDCIDCGSCVRVCPTGIDIRNGTQLECVNCTACMDACDEVMLKINKPKKLIKYASLNQIENGTKFKITPRIIIYSLVLTFLVILTGTLLLTRSDVEATILRASGSLFQELPNGNISNLYNAKIINKTFEDMSVEIKMLKPEGKINLIGSKTLDLQPESLVEATFFVEMEKSQVPFTKNKIEIGIYSNGNLIESTTTNFQSPGR